MLLQCKGFIFLLFNPWPQPALRTAATASPLQVFSNHLLSLHILTTCCVSPVMNGCGGCDGFMVHRVHVGLNLTQWCQRNVTTEPQLSETAHIMPWCSPLKQGIMLLKQLYWRLKRLGLESTPSNNNNNYNNNYMFIYTIYRLKNAML